MVEVPADIPLTNPDVFIVATEDVVLVHVPPDTLFVNNVVLPTHTEAVPPIAEGEASREADVVYVAVHPTPEPLLTVTEYVPEESVVAPITLADEVDAPVITAGPVHEYPVTLAGLLAVRVNVLPSQIGPLLVTLPRKGIGFTVTVTNELQPPATVYVIFAVPTPAAVTKPEPAPTLATPALLLVQVPLGAVLDKVDVAPTHRFIAPVLAGGLVQGKIIFTL